MEVSTFELIFKPQSPAAPQGVAAVDRVIQGYFLAITNLESVELRYRLEFIVPPPPAGTTNGAFRTPAGNTLVFVDSGGADNTQGVLSGSATQQRFVPSTGLVRIPAQATALVAVLPSAFGPLPGDPSPLTVPNFETRGYVRIALPAVRVPGLAFRTVAQSATPVKVLLTPQHRATFFKADNTISDQIQATLPLASGQALNTLDPESGGFFFPTIELAEIAPGVVSVLEGLRPEERSELLAALLGDLDVDRSDLAALNRALASADIPLAIERRRRAGG